MAALLSSLLDDPLDAEKPTGAPNWLTGMPYSAERTAWAATWSKFPIYDDKATLAAVCESFDQNDVTVIIAATGGGKTVVCPPLMLRRALVADPACKVAVTVPKRAIASSSAEGGAKTLDVAVGAEVGLIYRGSPADAHDRRLSRLIYCTDGSLLSQARKDKEMRAYGAVLIDEVHERPVPTDMLMAAVRRALVARRDSSHSLRLVLMSATIDPEPFRRYYESSGLRVGVVEVAGATRFPIEIGFAASDDKDHTTTFLSRGVQRAIDIVVDAEAAADRARRANPRSKSKSKAQSKSKSKSKSNKSSKSKSNSKDADGNILFFVPTTRDATQGCGAFTRACGDRGARDTCAAVDCAGLYSKLDRELQGRVLSPSSTGKLVFATNVAESSVTIPGLRHVIDSGLQLTSTWMADVHATRIDKAFASKAQIVQRIGRVGRVGPGSAHLLYSKSKYDGLPEYPSPAVLGVDLTEHVLSILCHGGVSLTLSDAIGDLMELLTPPTTTQVVGAISFLHFHRLIDIYARDPPPAADVKGGGAAQANHRSRGAAQANHRSRGAAQVNHRSRGAAQANESLAAHPAGLSFLDVPYARLMAPPGAFLEMYDGRVTEHGRTIQRVCEELKMGLWNALLVAAGIVYGTIKRIGTLASLLESCGGDVASMFTDAPDARKRATASLKTKSPGDDFETLVSIYEGVYLKEVSRSENPRSAAQSRGLSFGAWAAAHERVRDDQTRTSRMAARWKEIGLVQRLKASCPLYALPARISNTSYTLAARALMAARMYHAAVPSRVKGQVTTVAPPATITVAPEWTLSHPPSGPFEAVVCDAMVGSSQGSGSGSGIGIGSGREPTSVNHKLKYRLSMVLALPRVPQGLRP
jgi:superfamily II DNA/RNA helicase